MTSIDGKLLKKMIIAGANNLNRNKKIVDELNVFPVPDGDTGTNMSLTVISAAKEIQNINTNDIYEIAKSASDGSLRGARGNSGVILSQLFRGFAKGLKGHESADAYTIAQAFKKGALTAYKAVMKPKEGTILTVAKAIAEKAIQLADETDDIEVLLKESIDYGNQILNKTPNMLPVLKQAGVVDSGGKGLIYILLGAFDGIHLDEFIDLEDEVESTDSSFSAIKNLSQTDITFGYCTEFFINVKQISDKELNKFKSYLNSMGDSIVVAEDDDIVKVHVHSDHPGLILEKAISIGSLSNLKIDNMRQQHNNIIDFKTQPPKQEMDISNDRKTAFITIAAGKGIIEIFENLSADVVIEGGQTMNPSTEDIIDAAEKLNSQNIIILPNNKNIILTAQQAAKFIKDKNVEVLPTTTIPQGISAMISYDDSKPLNTAIEIMKKSISQVKTGQLTSAIRDTVVNNVSIKQGDIIGIIENNIDFASESLKRATKELVDKLIDSESEIVSLYYGQDMELKDVKELADYISHIYPQCDIEIHYGQQPIYYLIVSVE